jgi:NitT/TauT family transport system substrate-binding protein
MGRKRLLAVAVAAFAVAAVGASAAQARTHARKLDNVTLQLKWVTDTQFGGYYEAQALGYYKKFGLNVTLKPGGPSITPEQVVASGRAQIGVDWLPSLLATRDTGTDLVNIAQMFARSGMTEIAWKTSGITSVAQMKGKKVGVWCCGNQYELYAALTKYGMDPTKNQGVTIVNQPFDMNLFLQHKVDAAAAMTYNELAQVMETKNPKTGKLYTLADLNVFPMQKQGTGMLEDGLFTTQTWLNANRDVAERFIAASDWGWIYCRDHVAQCVQFVLKQGTALPAGHQTWEMNEVNKLIWPNKLGIGIMDPKAYAFTAKTTAKYNKLRRVPGHEAYRTDLAKAAVAQLKKQGIDVYGRGWHKAKVAITPGGK